MSPAHRSGRLALGTTIGNHYSSRFAEMRSELRRQMHAALCGLTGDRQAQMYWTPHAYRKYVVQRHRVKLVGWPKSLRFCNLSFVRGGNNTLRLLYNLWTDGTMRFERLSGNEQHEDLEMPGDPLQYAAAQPHPAIRMQRSDVGKHRMRPITNPLGLPLRRMRLTGAKSLPMVPDEWDDEIESFSDEELDRAMEDEIEDADGF
ncbi:hypothetical protein A0H81_09266 [Grifola frondosa]|uniref:Uncharacterized protein n=1 Tax=Grifola frondosa TaxID=5627 RepID=A0A1C7M1A7_GRIFR|nr:hypothetical protein A0H81_09266 [Grifola frondosa]